MEDPKGTSRQPANNSRQMKDARKKSIGKRDDEVNNVLKRNFGEKTPYDVIIFFMVMLHN